MSTGMMKVLCVDDEVNLLAGLRRNLSEHFDVSVATNGEEGLVFLECDGPFAVVLSDMRMPGMNGATFLEKARQISPDTVRILLTGQTDIDSAIAAVNEGQIFRFLMKPCPKPHLLSAITLATQQYKLQTAEKELLEKTLRGSIKALTDVLALVSPIAFGRGQRVQRLATNLAEQRKMKSAWLVDVCAMLSQLNFVTLPDDLVEKVQTGKPLLPSEQSVLSKSEGTIEQLLGNIPRLEKIRWILQHYRLPTSYLPEDEEGECARVLRIAVDFDILEAQQLSRLTALDILRGRTGQYRTDILNDFVTLMGGEESEVLREVHLGELRVGMIIAQEVRMQSGMLLVTVGYEVTPTFLERLRNFPPNTIREPILIKEKQ
jgi:CheY-like chemotaxis protein